MKELKRKYQILFKQLACPIGDEQTISELLWNEGIMDSIEILFDECSDETEKMIRLNLV